MLAAGAAEGPAGPQLQPVVPMSLPGNGAGHNPDVGGTGVAVGCGVTVRGGYLFTGAGGGAGVT